MIDAPHHPVEPGLPGCQDRIHPVEPGLPGCQDRTHPVEPGLPGSQDARAGQARHYAPKAS